MMTETCKLQFLVANKLPTIVDKLSLLVVLKLVPAEGMRIIETSRSKRVEEK
jgi:hypothetical protein